MKKRFLPALLLCAATSLPMASYAGPYDDQVGGISLEENYELAKKFPTPSAWLLANTCSACHGTNGAEFNDLMPPLAGIDREEFIHIMQKYKHGDPHDFIVMGIVAQPLTDKEIELMADYFSKQKPTQWVKKWKHQHGSESE